MTEASKDEFPCLKELTPRMEDTLAAHKVTPSESPGRIIELRQSLGRNVAHHNSVSCVTPKWRPWLTGRNRFIIGAESLRFMGISYSDDLQGRSTLLDLDSSMLSDLAGNAVHAGQYLAMLLAMFSALGSTGYLQRERRDCSHGESEECNDGPDDGMVLGHRGLSFLHGSDV